MNMDFLNSCITTGKIITVVFPYDFDEKWKLCCPRGSRGLIQVIVLVHHFLEHFRGLFSSIKYIYLSIYLSIIYEVFSSTKGTSLG